MRHFIFPRKDATIYKNDPNKNSGHDEIIEIGKTADGFYPIRSLLYFDIPSNLPSSTNFELVLRIANSETLKVDQQIELWNVKQEWSEGSGYYYQELVSDSNGVTWNKNKPNESWESGSFGGSLVGPVISGSLSYPLDDITIDMTNYVKLWLSGSIENNGILLKFPTFDENDVDNKGNIKIFSNNTHTIYRPTLVAKWDDQVYITGSNHWPVNNMKVNASVKPSYRVNEVVKVLVYTREAYPQKTFTNVLNRYSGNNYLPSSSYYSIIDDLSGTTIIPFSDSSKISVNGNENFFTFEVKNMYPLRYYRIMIKIEHDGIVEIFDNNTLFSVK